MINCDPNALLREAVCYCYSDKKLQDAVIVYLLCKIANGGGGACAAQSGAGSPVGTATPAFVGQLYHDTVADTYYRSTGLTNADWTAIGAATVGVTFLSTAIGELEITEDDTTPVINFPNCTSINDGNFLIVGNALLTALNAPAIISFTADLTISGNPILTSIDLSSWVSCVGNVSMLGNPALTTILCPSWVPTDGKNLNFSGCALTATTVELILRRCVLAGVTTCTITLNGGTNAGTASLNPQGQADVTTLGAQLTINP